MQLNELIYIKASIYTGAVIINYYRITHLFSLEYIGNFIVKVKLSLQTIKFSLQTIKFRLGAKVPYPYY